MVPEEGKITRSVRAHKEIFQRLNEISKEKGMDQGATLEALLNAWDVQAAKGLVPERAADIADFDTSIQAVQKAFLRSLDLASGAESRARNAYAAQLDAMSGTIARLEKDLAEARETAESATKELTQAIAENERLKAELANTKSVQAVLAAYAAKLNDAKAKPEPKPKKNKRDAKPEPEPENLEEQTNVLEFPKEAQG